MKKFKILLIVALFTFLSVNICSAKIVFLPDKGDDLGFSGSQGIGQDHNVGNPCSDFPLTTCPANGSCSKCTFNNAYKLTSCKSGYKISGNSCVPSTCQTVNSSYLAEIPNNQFCERFQTNDLTCFKGCRGVSCGGYPLNCDTIAGNQAGLNISTYQKCPDCENDSVSSSVGKCSPNLCKILTCTNNKKVNGNGSACINKDSTCPSSHPFKSCETSVQDTAYAEDGTACYTCKAPPAPATCNDWIKKNYPNFNIVSDSSNYTSSGDIAVLGNVSADYGVSLSSSNKLVGPKYFSYDKCQAMATPTLNIASKNGPAVTSNGGTISDINIIYDPVSYEIWGKNGICSYADSCSSSPENSGFYNYAQSNEGSCGSYPPEYWMHNTPKNDADLICMALSFVSDSNCYEGYNGNHKQCSEDSYYSCSCNSANMNACVAFNYATDYCINNNSPAIKAYGTINNVTLTIKSGVAVENILQNKGGTLNLQGNNTFTASSSRGSTVFIADTTNVVSGTTLFHVPDEVVVGGILNVRQGAKVNIEWASIAGFMLGNSAIVNIEGTMNIRNYASSGRFNGDFEFTSKPGSGYVSVSNTGCLIMANGAGTSEGLYGYGGVYSGYFKYVNGSNLSIAGTCRKSSTSGTYTVRSQPKPNSLYGAFTSHPSGFSGSCGNCK